MARLIHDNRGLSLVEVVVSIGIFTLIIGAVMGLYSNSVRTKDIVYDQLLTQSEGRRAVTRFIDDVRSANYSSIGAYPIQTAGTSTITFYSDIDGDTYRERVRYFMATGTLKRGITRVSGIPLAYVTSTEVITELAHSIINTSSIFYYYDQNYNGGPTSTALAQPVNTTAVRVVEIRLVIERDPFKSPLPLYVQTKTEIRNLKNN